MTGRSEKRPIEDAPGLAQQDWDAMEGAQMGAERVLQNDELRHRLHEGEKPDHASEDDDDNAYQQSDEALPEDPERNKLSRNPSREKREA